MSDPRPIGLFDSGLGGLSIWRAVREQMPDEEVIYFGDSSHIPYGSRSHAEIEQFSHGIVQFLAERWQVKLVIVACNTASAASLPSLRRHFALPIVGMEPAVKPAVERSQRRRVGVIATQATIQGELFARLVERFSDNVDVLTQPCPGLVEAVEEGRIEHPETEALLRRYLEPLCAAGIDELVLGCTHYPFLLPAIQRIVGPQVEVIDPAPAVARQAERVLEQEDARQDAGSRGEDVFICSGEPAVFARAMREILGIVAPVHDAHWSDAGELHLAEATQP